MKWYVSMAHGIVNYDKIVSLEETSLNSRIPEMHTISITIHLFYEYDLKTSYIVDFILLNFMTGHWL